MTVAFVAPSPSEGARTRWCRSAASGADEVPFRRGNGRRRRTACEGCSGMTAAFVAPSPSEGARPR